MRKRTIRYLFDNLMWYLVYLLPLIFACIYWIKSGAVDLSTILTTSGFNVLSTNIVFTTLCQLFGTGGLLPLFASSDILLYLSYFVSVSIIHLAVDTLLFIVRIAHDWLSNFGGGKYD